MMLMLIDRGEIQKQLISRNQLLLLDFVKLIICQSEENETVQLLFRVTTIDHKIV